MKTGVQKIEAPLTHFPVYILPLRNENITLKQIEKQEKRVYILPLRNENPL